MSDQAAEVDAALARLRAQGVKLKHLASLMGCSAERIRQRLAKHCWRENHRDDPFSTLPARVRNVLLAEGCYSLEAAVERLRSGELQKAPNFGAHSERVLREWLASLGITA